GMKGNAWNHHLSFDASVYYIDWKDIQLSLLDPTTQLLYFANASAAKSEGIELSAQVRPLMGLTIGGWMAWNEAQITQAFPNLDTRFAPYALPGDRLPSSSRWSGNLSVEDDFPLLGSATGFVNAAVSYVGLRWEGFPGSSGGSNPQPLRARHTYPP